MPIFLNKVVSVLAEIRTPLTVGGLSVLVLYGIYHQILKLRIFESVGRKGTLSIVHTILDRLFWLAIIAIVLGGVSYLTSLYLDRHPPSLRSSTRIVDARLDRELAKPLIAAILEAPNGVRSNFAIVATTDNPTYPEPVAAVDFKLQNTGQGTALIWRAGVEVVDAKINTAPVLHFRYGSYDSGGNALDFHAINTGWGPAKCELEIKNPELERLYPRPRLSFKGDLYTGDRTILRLSHAGVNRDRLTEIRKLIDERDQALQALSIALDRRDAAKLKTFRAPLFSDSEVRQLENIIDHIQSGERIESFEREYFTKSYLPKHAIPVTDLTVVGNCSDDNRHPFSINDEIRPTGGLFFGDDGGRLWIGDSTFDIEYDGPPSNYSLFSEPTVASIIDPDAIPSEKTYPLSRAIAPGGVERFFIVLGTSKSAKISVRFKIYVDQSQLKSDLFTVDLWCPTDCRLPEVVPDGTQLTNENGTWLFPHPKSLFDRIGK